MGEHLPPLTDADIAQVRFPEPETSQVKALAELEALQFNLKNNPPKDGVALARMKRRVYELQAFLGIVPQDNYAI